MASYYSTHASHALQRVPDLAHYRNASLQNQRARLSVTLVCCEDDGGQAQLRSLFHTPVGVYVVDSRVERGEIRVIFDIAVDDIDFTLHTLIHHLPEALIGRLDRTALPRRLISASTASRSSPK